MKLRDGTYAFGLLATMNDVQQCTAVSVPLLKSSAPIPSLSILPAPEIEQALPEAVHEARPPATPEEESEAIGESDEEDEGEEDEDDDDDEEDDEEEDDDEAEEDAAVDVLPSRSAAASAAASSREAAPIQSGDSGRHSASMPLKKRNAAAAAAMEAALAIEHSDEMSSGPMRFRQHGGTLRRRWAPRIDDTALSWVAVYVLARLRRRNTPLSSEAMVPVAMAALKRLPNSPPHLTPRDAAPALVDTLRVLVRIGYVARRRMGHLDGAGAGGAAGGNHAATYALSSFGQEQLFTATQQQQQLQAHGGRYGQATGPAIGNSPAIGVGGGGGGGVSIGFIGSSHSYRPAQSQPSPPPPHSSHASPAKPAAASNTNRTELPTPSRNGGAPANPNVPGSTGGAGGAAGASSSATKPAQRVASNGNDGDEADKLKRTASDAGSANGKPAGGKYRISRKRST